jgi:hypothetical protein
MLSNWNDFGGARPRIRAAFIAEMNLPVNPNLMVRRLHYTDGELRRAARLLAESALHMPFR